MEALASPVSKKDNRLFLPALSNPQRTRLPWSWQASNQEQPWPGKTLATNCQSREKNKAQTQVIHLVSLLLQLDLVSDVTKQSNKERNKAPILKWQKNDKPNIGQDDLWPQVKEVLVMRGPTGSPIYSSPKFTIEQAMVCTLASHAEPLSTQWTHQAYISSMNWSATWWINWSHEAKCANQEMSGKMDWGRAEGTTCTRITVQVFPHLQPHKKGPMNLGQHPLVSRRG